MIISLIIKKIKKIFLNFTNKLSFLNTNTIETKEEQVTIEKDNDVEETKEEEIIVEKDTNVKKTNNNFLNVPSSLEGFKNTNTEVIIDENNREIIHFYGELTVNKEDYICPNCGHKMHIKSNRKR